MIEVLKEGNNMKDRPQFKTYCGTCKCEFSYDKSEINSDRDGSYVICPNESCKSFISHDLAKLLFNPFK